MPVGSSPAAEPLSAPSPLAMTRGPRRLRPGRRDAPLLRPPSLCPVSRRGRRRRRRHSHGAQVHPAGRPVKLTFPEHAPLAPLKVGPRPLESGQSQSPAAPPPANPLTRRPFPNLPRGSLHSEPRFLSLESVAACIRCNPEESKETRLTRGN